MRISDWISDVCSSDLLARLPDGRPPRGVRMTCCAPGVDVAAYRQETIGPSAEEIRLASRTIDDGLAQTDLSVPRSEEHTSELQSLMRIPYAVFCLKQKLIILNYHAQAESRHTT